MLYCEVFVILSFLLYMLNSYRTMWILVMFDLPAKTKKERKEYRLFRKNLLEQGFTKMQFSVYTRFVIGTEAVEKYARCVERFLPPGGEVRVVAFTDKQFERMHVFFGKTRQPQKNPWQQLMFF